MPNAAVNPERAFSRAIGLNGLLCASSSAPCEGHLVMATMILLWELPLLYVLELQLISSLPRRGRADDVRASDFSRLLDDETEHEASRRRNIGKASRYGFHMNWHQATFAFWDGGVLNCSA